MRILQVLPELNAGGVERGTVEFAHYLVSRGHQSWVMSAGGRQTSLLESQGSSHIQLPVHRKSLWSLRQVPAIAKAITQVAPDIIHVRSRLPAWLVWLAIGRRPRAERPVIVSTFHGAYSVNRYSAIMGKADGIIAISNYIRDYITGNYSSIDGRRIRVIHRGVDAENFSVDPIKLETWREQFWREFPQLEGRKLMLMPGRLSRWKGQHDFIDIVAGLRAQGESVGGLIVGAVTPGKDDYKRELKQRVSALGLDDTIFFSDHRADIAELFAHADLVCNLSSRAEPFGRTVIESLAVGTPVLAYNSGGPAESLAACLPQGLVPQGDLNEAIQRAQLLIHNRPSVVLPEAFTLAMQAKNTVEYYRDLLTLRDNQIKT